MKLLVISFRTTGLLKEMYEEYCRGFSSFVDLYCLTNDNINDSSLNAIETCHIRFKRQEPWSYLSLFKINRAKKFINKVQPDIVMFFTPHPDNIFLIKYASKYPLVAQIHNPLPHSGTALTEKIISGIQKKLYFKFCDGIFVSGEKLKDDIVSHYLVNPEKIHSYKFAALSNLKNYEYKIQEEIYDVIFFGRIEYYKGIDILLESLKYSHNHLKVLIVGKGKPYFEVSQEYADVQFINEYVSDKKLAEMIIQSKIVVMPYRDATGTSTVIQAFSFGKPVISSNAGVFPEYVGNGGLVVPKDSPMALAQAIDILIDDSKKRYDMGKIGLSYMQEDFEINKFCKRYIKDFEQILIQKGAKIEN
ncbi:glycosyltransferase family 4 protein [Enterocloster aldenensis]|uniref:glycosyltransferase family 4 protein n=1 Tax=Enterocloster aldenensis TaxID=358742 RepID=UPI004024CD57